jgi:hypothetical protein
MKKTLFAFLAVFFLTVSCGKPRPEKIDYEFFDYPSPSSALTGIIHGINDNTIDITSPHISYAVEGRRDSGTISHRDKQNYWNRITRGKTVTRITVLEEKHNPPYAYVAVLIEYSVGQPYEKILSLWQNPRGFWILYLNEMQVLKNF